MNIDASERYKKQLLEYYKVYEIGEGADGDITIFWDKERWDKYFQEEEYLRQIHKEYLETRSPEDAYEDALDELFIAREQPDGTTLGYGWWLEVEEENREDKIAKEKIKKLYEEYINGSTQRRQS